MPIDNPRALFSRVVGPLVQTPLETAQFADVLAIRSHYVIHDLAALDAFVTCVRAP